MAKRVIVQIYEIQTPAEAEAVIETGVDNIGSVILEQENWKNPVLKETVDLVRDSGAKSSLIPLYNDTDAVAETLDYYRPDIVHFCENLTDGLEISLICGTLAELQEDVKKRFPEISVMRSIPIPPPGLADFFPSIELAKKFEHVSDFFLTDTLLIDKEQPVDGFVGITGKTCDWGVASELVKTSSVPVILAGGIDPENVREGILRVCPAGVDSCTGTNAVGETGVAERFRKDIGKVRRLVEETRRAGELI